MHLNIERITLHGHDKNWYMRLVLTFHRLRAEDSRSCGVFHTVGTESGRSLRLEPSMWMILLKHLSSKCSEQTMNLPCAVKFARWVLTTLTHLSRSTLFTGLQCSDIPAWWSEELLYPWTTHRLPGMIQLKTYEHNIILRAVFSRVESLTSFPPRSLRLGAEWTGTWSSNGGHKISRYTVEKWCLPVVVLKSGLVWYVQSMSTFKICKED